MLSSSKNIHNFDQEIEKYRKLMKIKEIIIKPRKIIYPYSIFFFFSSFSFLETLTLEFGLCSGLSVQGFRS